jgi:hypothetical protein
MRVTKTMSDQSVDTIDRDSIMILSYVDKSISSNNKHIKTKTFIELLLLLFHNIFHHILI